MTAWEEYLAAAGALDGERRNEAAAIVAQEAAAAAAAEELAGTRRRVAAQAVRLVEISDKLAIAAPQLTPTAGDRSAAIETLKAADSSASADPSAGISAALRGATATLDAADATLFSAVNPGSTDGLLPTWPPLLRNGIVYFWFAALSLVAIAEITKVAGPSARANVLDLVFAVVVPTCAWLVAWMSVGIMFGADVDGRRHRSPWFGALLCVVPLVVGLALASR